FAFVSLLVSFGSLSPACSSAPPVSHETTHQSEEALQGTPSVTHPMIIVSEASFACYGISLTDSVVLTSKSCLQRQSDDGAIAYRVSATGDKPFVLTTGHDDDPGSDLALLHLKTAIPFSVYPNVGYQQPAGATVTVAGYELVHNANGNKPVEASFKV